MPAFAYWPGVIKPGQVIGDIVSETDLFTTFAHLGDTTANIPTDRIIDEIDQTRSCSMAVVSAGAIRLNFSQIEETDGLLAAGLGPRRPATRRS